MITKKKKRISCLLRTAVSVMAFLETGVVSASSAVWNGTESAFWTNSANWSAAPYPSGDESANFNTAGNGYATVALDGLSSIRYVAFDTAAAAAYMIGSGGANVQKLTVVAEGQISVSSSTGADQAFAAELRLPGNYTFSNSHPTHTLTFNNVTCTGNSSLSLNGSGALSILGNLSRGSSVFNVYQNGTGPVMLSGTDNQVNAWTFNGVNAVLNLAAGSLTSFNGGGGNNLMATQNTVINGPGAMKLSTGGGENFADNSVASGKTLTINAKLTGATGFEYWNGSMFGTVALLGQNDFTLNVIMNAAGTIAVTNIGNQASTTSNLGAGTKVIFNSSSGGASRLMYTGPGEETDRILEFRKNGIVDQSGQSGLLKYTSDVSSSGGLTMTLQGSTLGTGEIAGVIPSSTAVAKSGSGTWFLSASNTYSGATSVDAGTLIVCGTNGAVKSTSGLTLNGGTFALLNTATSNLEDRLSDALPVTLNGGTFCFSNDLAVAAFSETAGVLTVNSGAGTVTAVQAAAGGTSALRFAAIIRVGNGTVNFTGEGLGDSDRNRIFIAGQADGLIGSWATWNGTRYAAYSGSRGVYAASEAVDIAARGYSVITNDASLAVRISLPGESGPIALETSPVSSVGTLIQNSDTPAVVTMTNTLFRLSDLRVVSGKASLTIGTAPREGTLSVLSEGGCLSVENDSVNGTLTVNASVMSNSAACSLVKNGVGTVVLAGENLYGGATQVNNGELVFGSGRHAIGQLTVATASFILTNAAPAYVSVTNNSAYIGNGSRDFGHMTLGGNASWAGYLYPFNVGQATLVIGHYGRGILTLQDNASVTQRLYVGNAGGSAGAVYQNGGVMHNWGGSSSDSRIGMTGYGYYELNSGTFTNMGYTQLGRDYTGIGILKQFGGAFKMGAVYNGTLAISRGGTGVVYMADGTFNTSASLSLGEASDNGLIRGYAEFTMAGGVAEINGNVNMADRTNMFAVVNLNGGVLAANAITRGMRTGSLALVRFDGGTLKARTSGNLFGSGTAAPDAVNIYDGGAVFDIPDAVCTIPVPLLAPAGNGVTSIGVTSRAGYIGPPMVTISGGGGSGATAVARFDSASGTVTGIEVTSPGFGYTSTPTVSLSGGGTNVQTSLGSVSLGANMSGGITKLGSGTLTLSATNTYAGATIISNGTLRLGCVQALPANGVVQFEGGVLDLNGFSATNGGVIATGNGTIMGGTLTCGSVTQTGGVLSLGAVIDSAAHVQIEGGIFQILPVQPGLYEAPLAGSFNTTESMITNIQIWSTTRMANTNAKPPWSDNITYLYTGYLWNNTGTNATWTFAENVDDSTLLKIDGTTLIGGGNGWSTPTIATKTLTPGAHVFEARFGNGTGGAGLVDGSATTSLSWWKTNTFGFGVDYWGRNETNVANYVTLTDSGDGRLLSLTAVNGGLTNRISSEASVELGASGVLDLGTNIYSQTLASLGGLGIVSNGVLAVTGAIMPGGTNAIGSLTVANSAGLSGKLLVDVAADGSCDRLVIAGNLNLSGLSLEIANPGQLNTWKVYTVATVSGASAGTFASVTVPDVRWNVIYRPDGRVQLIFANGTLLIMR